jgi:hypothetical protein
MPDDALKCHHWNDTERLTLSVYVSCRIAAGLCLYVG